MKDLTIRTIMISYMIMIGSFFFMGTKAKTYKTTPEKGITCIEVGGIWKDRKAPAGCFSGDINSSDVKFESETTRKYQKNF